MLQLPQRPGLDLPNSLARQRELLAHFLQCGVAVSAEATQATIRSSRGVSEARARATCMDTFSLYAFWALVFLIAVEAVLAKMVW